MQNSPPDSTASFPTAASLAAVFFLCHSPQHTPPHPHILHLSIRVGVEEDAAPRRRVKPIDKVNEGGRCRMCHLDEVGHTLVSGASSLFPVCGLARPSAGWGGCWAGGAGSRACSQQCVKGLGQEHSFPQTPLI